MSLIPNESNIGKANGSRPLETNASFGYAKAKAEKLVTGVHMITRHIRDEEPLRTKLRQLSLDILTDIVNGRDRGDGSLGSDISEMVSLLDVASAAQFVSKNNTEIIKREYAALSVFVDESGESFATNTSTISPEFFSVPKPEVKRLPAQVVEPVTAKVQQNTPAKTMSVIKDKQISKGQTKPAKPREKSVASISKKNARRDAIIRLFNDHKSISVRDVVEVIPGVSEKTLQRELVALVEEGILRKEGERRWSVYYKV